LGPLKKKPSGIEDQRLIHELPIPSLNDREKVFFFTFLIDKAFRKIGYQTHWIGPVFGSKRKKEAEKSKRG
jgi:hypothetical protein